MELATLEELPRAEALQPTEPELVEAAKRDPEALAALYRLHHGAVSRHVLRRVGQMSIAEDLVADVFVQMVRYLPKYRLGATPFRAWLYRLATNRVNRWARWQRRRAWQMLQDIAQHDPRERQLDEAEHVRTALLTLPVHFQSVLALHYLEDLSVAEIAQVLECAEGTVKSRLARGRDLLRNLLTESEGGR